ncbi:MAG: hypothetical protein V7750_12505 [Sneathiella sp.]
MSIIKLFLMVRKSDGLQPRPGSVAIDLIPDRDALFIYANKPFLKGITMSLEEPVDLPNHPVSVMSGALH